jgi:hypothetical protein
MSVRSPPCRGWGLSLAGTRATDLSALHTLPELEEVDLEDTAVDAAQTSALRRARPAVRILGLP